MKKILLFAIVAMVGCNMLMYAQDEVFPLSGAKWTELSFRTDPLGGGNYDSTYYSYQLEGDTVINDIRRSKLYYSCPKCFDPEEPSLLAGFFHVDEKKVYYRVYEWHFTSCVEETEDDYLLYDFGLDVGDNVSRCEYGRSNRITDIDSVMLGQQKRKRYTLERYWLSQYCIEGMGDTGGLLSPIRGVLGVETIKIVCFSQNDEVLYLDPDFIDCSTPKISIEKADVIDGLTIYPNPFERDICVEYSTEELKSLALFDQSGRRVFQKGVEGFKACIEPNLPPGIYALVIETASGKQYSKKIIKQ